jgi:hypothetical protein
LPILINSILIQIPTDNSIYKTTHRNNSYHDSTASGVRELFKEFFKNTEPHSSLDLKRAAPPICRWLFTTAKEKKDNVRIWMPPKH